MLAVFRGDPVETELAGVLEDGRSVAEMCSLNWTPTPLHLPQQRLQAAPALLQRIWSKVDAAQLQQAERLQERPVVVSLTVEHFEVRHALGVAADRAPPASPTKITLDEIERTVI
jgi:hypothetical protein